MIPVYEEVYSLDSLCYQNGLNEYILMENAAKAMYNEIKQKGFKSVLVISGGGNNGADGIALARMLLGEVDVELFLPMELKSKMAKFQFEIYKNYGGKYFNVPQETKQYECYVDAIFGSGLKRELSPKINKIIKVINRRSGFKIACDVPTGIDEKGMKRGEVFEANLTVTMGALKLSMFSDFSKDFVGDVKIANLGISFLNYTKKSDYYLLEKADMHLPIRDKKNSHKGKFGHLGVLVGEKCGAGIISALAGLRFGAGLVSVVTKEKNNIPYELMQAKSIDERFSAISFGQGMGSFYDNELKKLINLKIPKVVDADMFYKKEILGFLDKFTVFTPHPKEFTSFLKICELGEYSSEEVQNRRFELALKFSKKYPNSVLLLKGANTIIAYKEKIYINPYGTQALSKGGSGDVLAGLIASLLAQGYHPLKAAITASLAHAQAGDVTPNYALTPLKIIENLEKLNSHYSQK
jgi:hydroxyethylthiazole kinase-like uncharacterized protein yjeF